MVRLNPLHYLGRAKDWTGSQLGKISVPFGRRGFGPQPNPGMRIVFEDLKQVKDLCKKEEIDLVDAKRIVDLIVTSLDQVSRNAGHKDVDIKVNLERINTDTQEAVVKIMEALKFTERINELLKQAETVHLQTLKAAGRLDPQLRDFKANLENHKNKVRQAMITKIYRNPPTPEQKKQMEVVLASYVADLNKEAVAAMKSLSTLSRSSFGNANAIGYLRTVEKEIISSINAGQTALVRGWTPDRANLYNALMRFKYASTLLGNAIAAAQKLEDFERDVMQRIISDLKKVKDAQDHIGIMVKKGHLKPNTTLV